MMTQLYLPFCTYSDGHLIDGMQIVPLYVKFPGQMTSILLQAEPRRSNPVGQTISNCE